MSIEALMWAKQHKTGSPTRKAILIILANYADERWSCYPSQETIAEQAECSSRTVRTVLAEWESTGLISREVRMKDHGRGRTSDRIFIHSDYDQPETDARPTGNSRPDQPEAVSGKEKEEQKDEQNSCSSAMNTFAGKKWIGTDGDPWWLEFWTAYPRKQSKIDAQKAWRQVMVGETGPKANARRVINAARRYAQDPNRTAGYTKLPATWLRAGCWEDGPLPPRDGGPPSGGPVDPSLIEAMKKANPDG